MIKNGTEESQGFKMASRKVFNTFSVASRSVQPQKGDYFEGNVAKMIVLFFISQK